MTSESGSNSDPTDIESLLPQLKLRAHRRIGPQLRAIVGPSSLLGDVLLDFSSLATNLDLELRLSRMTSWVLQADATGLAYAFRLGAIEYPAAIGASHRIDCLSALALYEG